MIILILSLILISAIYFGNIVNKGALVQISDRLPNGPKTAMAPSGIMGPLPCACYLTVLLAAGDFVSVAQAQGEDYVPHAQRALQREQVRLKAIQEGTQDTKIEPFDLGGYTKFKDNLKDEYGIEYLLYYTLMGHNGTKGRSNLNGQLHSITAWTPFRAAPNAGSFIFYYMTVGQYKSTAAKLTNSLGLTTGINDSGSDIDLYRFAGWHQPIGDELIDIYAGQFLLRDLYDFGNYASDDTRNFISEIMSANPTATLPAPGLGLAATVKISDSWSIGGGFTDANAGAGDLWDFSTVSKGDFAAMGYLNYRPDIPGLGKGNYQFNVYSVDSTDQAAYSRGVSAIIEQDIGERYAVFLKFNRADKRRTATKQSIGAAVIQKGIFSAKDDLLGLGLGYGDPTDPSFRNEYVAEAFWRVQLSPGIQITPAVQFWMNPSRSPDSDTEAVFSLRATVDF